MKILVTGVGITGKSLFRRVLVAFCRILCSPVFHYDTDEFKEIRDPYDKDCLIKLPKEFNENAIYVIKDVHGPTNKAKLPLSAYDQIFYLYPSLLSHICFWLNRMPYWYRDGKHSWDANNGWQGTGKPRDIKNLPGIAKEFLRDMLCRRKWVKQDLEALKGLNYTMVKAKWTSSGPKFDVTQ